MLVTTHYLDEAERCHRVALIHAGRLAAIGTTTEVKRIFAGRPILEVRAPQAGGRDARCSTRCPDVEKTSLFGTAVHAVLRERRVDAGRRSPRALRAAGVAVDGIAAGHAVARGRLPRRRRASAGGGARMRKALAVYRKELRQISRDRRTLLILVFVPAFFLLLYGYALNFDIRHIALGREDRDGTPESRALVSAFVNSGYFDLRRRRRTRRPRSTASLDLNTRARRAGHPGGLRPRRRRRPAAAGAGHHQRRQRQHRDDGAWATPAASSASAGAELAPGDASCGRRRSPSSRASGTTRSCAARSSSCPG